MVDYFKGGEHETCQILGVEGVALQLALLTLSFATLLSKPNYSKSLAVKRKCESHKRAWFVFCLDNSKQVLSSILLHIYNVLSSKLLAAESNYECQWYFINFTLDVIEISLFSYLLLKLSDCLLRKYTTFKFETGKYIADGE